MKAWNDLVNSKDISLWTTEDSEWYIDLGAKIERFNNGRIVIKNIISRGDNFIDLTPNQLSYFKLYGWDAGRYKICVDEYHKKIREARVLGDNVRDYEKKLLKFQIKLEEYLQDV
tara:strand:- start:1223 stop:1567 length:345 start_codon:yes stop_codon:yes gene_type:complete